jgi:hypothetical protein
VPFKRIYTYYMTDLSRRSEDIAATTMLELHNTAAAGLGKPLPAGSVSVTEAAVTGYPVLIGQDRVLDTPEGLPLYIETGKAIEVRVHRRMASELEVGSGNTRRRRLTLEVAVENDKSVPIEFELAQFIFDGAHEIAETLPTSSSPRA